MKMEEKVDYLENELVKFAEAFSELTFNYTLLHNFLNCQFGEKFRRFIAEETKDQEENDEIKISKVEGGVPLSLGLGRGIIDEDECEITPTSGSTPGDGCEDYEEKVGFVAGEEGGNQMDDLLEMENNIYPYPHDSEFDEGEEEDEMDEMEMAPMDILQQVLPDQDETEIVSVSSDRGGGPPALIRMATTSPTVSRFRAGGGGQGQGQQQKSSGPAPKLHPQSLIKTAVKGKPPQAGGSGSGSRPLPVLQKKPAASATGPSSNGMSSTTTTTTTTGRTGNSSNFRGNEILLSTDDEAFKAGKYSKFYYKVNDELIQCKMCHKLLKRRGKFIQHLRTHTGEKPFSCEYCTASFSRKDNMNVHVAKHHPETMMPGFTGTGLPPRPQTSGPSTSAVYGFRCQFCKKPFASSTMYQNHLRLMHGLDVEVSSQGNNGEDGMMDTNDFLDGYYIDDDDNSGQAGYDDDDPLN